MIFGAIPSDNQFPEESEKNFALPRLGKSVYSLGTVHILFINGCTRTWSCSDNARFPEGPEVVSQSHFPPEIFGKIPVPVGFLLEILD